MDVEEDLFCYLFRKSSSASRPFLKAVNIWSLVNLRVYFWRVWLFGGGPVFFLIFVNQTSGIIKVASLHITCVSKPPPSLPTLKLLIMHTVKTPIRIKSQSILKMFLACSSTRASFQISGDKHINPWERQYRYVHFFLSMTYIQWQK